MAQWHRSKLWQKSSILANFKTPDLLSIVIVSYNVKYFLAQCLDAVQKSAKGIGAEIIVVDNNSSDGSVAFLQNKFPQVQTIALQENLGFARANNIGWKQSKGNYVLFLNPDTIIGEDCLRNINHRFEEDEQTGAMGVRMIDGSGRFLPESKRGFPGPAASFYKLSGLIHLFPRSASIAQYYLGHLPEKAVQPVEVLAGACMAVRRSLLEKTGGFDERFFMYGEDIDLSYQIRQLGYQNYYLGNTSIIHFKGESTRKNFGYTRQFYKAMKLFVDKHPQGLPGVLFKLAIGAGAFLSGIKQLLPSPRKRFAREQETTIVCGKGADCVGLEKKLPAVLPCAGILTVNDTRNLGSFIKPGNHIRLVFCPQELSYADQISATETWGSALQCWFYCVESEAIITSSTKGAMGMTIELGGENGTGKG